MRNHRKSLKRDVRPGAFWSCVGSTAQIARQGRGGMLDSVSPSLYYSVKSFVRPEHAAVPGDLPVESSYRARGGRDAIRMWPQSAARLDCAVTIAVGHSEFFQVVRRGRRSESLAGGPGGGRAQGHRKRKLLSTAGVRGAHAKALLAVPTLVGGQEVLEMAGRLASRSEACQRSLSQLRDVWQRVTAAGLSEHLLLDMGEVRRMEYYTGLVFDIYAEASGRGGGGAGTISDRPFRESYRHVLLGSRLPDAWSARAPAVWPFAAHWKRSIHGLRVALAGVRRNEKKTVARKDPGEAVRARTSPGASAGHHSKLPPQMARPSKPSGGHLADNPSLYKTLELLPRIIYRPVQRKLRAMVEVEAQRQVIDLLTHRPLEPRGRMGRIGARHGRI